MQEIRCKKCNKLLARVGEMKVRYVAADSNGNVKDIEHPQNIETKFNTDIKFFGLEIKCPRCGEMNTKKESVEDENDVRNDNDRQDNVSRNQTC